MAGLDLAVVDVLSAAIADLAPSVDGDPADVLAALILSAPSDAVDALLALAPEDQLAVVQQLIDAFPVPASNLAEAAEGTDLAGVPDSGADVTTDSSKIDDE